MTETVPKFDYPTGHEVWRWPEFRAFAERLGIAFDRPTKDINIFIPVEGIVTITEEYLGDTLFSARRRADTEMRKQRAEAGLPPVETTTAHNERFKTFRPLPNDRPAAEAGLHGLPYRRDWDSSRPEPDQKNVEGTDG